MSGFFHMTGGRCSNRALSFQQDVIARYVGLFSYDEAFAMNEIARNSRAEKREVIARYVGLFSYDKGSGENRSNETEGVIARYVGLFSYDV